MTFFVDAITAEKNLTHRSYSPELTTTTTTLNGTLVLDNLSSYAHEVIGTASGFNVQLPVATTLVKGWEFKIFNISALPLTIKYSTGTNVIQITADSMVTVTLDDNSSAVGGWIVIATDLSNIDMNNPNFLGAKDGFEDFMFDAYAGNGGNDNQYAFTAVPDTGSSNIDGAVEVAGSDYEGIHILNSLASATARPLVHAFNGVNRIKFGTHLESYEFRVRIETLATTAQKFTTRYGFMDIITAGLPSNGVLFSYDPVYPVTAVQQIVTATPVVTSREPSQTFTETLNGTAFSYLHSISQVVTVTPNSFPVATFQRISITWTRTNNTTYTVVINGTTCSYTSDASATDAEISAGLSTAINSNVGAAVTATNAKPVVVTSDILGTAFTYSGTNVTITLVTANVPKEIYTQTINGTAFAFTSDGTPTAAEVVAGLTSLINADGPLPVTASGTTTLILTGDVAGNTFTYSGSANLTQADTTAFPDATTVCNGLRSVINADVLHPVTATGTTTLIMSADVAGTAFTYSGTTNLVNVLTQANVPGVLYSGNWVATTVKSSSATSLNSGVPVVAGQWYRLKCIINATATQASFYVDNLFIGEIVVPQPVVGVRYVFKLEKTLGTESRTTSIDYISWRRTRG